MVHQPQAREPRLLGRPGELGERRRGRRGMAGKVEARDLQSELERHGILLLAGGRRRGGEKGGGYERDGACGTHGCESLGPERRIDLCDRPQLR